MGTSRLTALVATLVVALALAAVPASAQSGSSDPSEAQYGDQIPDTAGTGSASDSSDAGLESEIGFLPFTGLDLLIVGGVALVLTGTGFALRRLTEPRGPFV